MEQSYEQLRTPAERLTGELLVKADEFQREHDRALVTVGDSKRLRRSLPGWQDKMDKIRQEGAAILRELKSVLDARGLRELELLIANKWPLQEFDKEIARQDAEKK